MKCKDVRSLFSTLMDGELSAEDKSSVEAHLCGCRACQDGLDELVHSREALRSHLSLRVSQGFEDRVLEAIGEAAGESTCAARRPMLEALIDFMQPGWRQIAASVAGALLLLYVTCAAAGLGFGSAVRSGRSEPGWLPEPQMVLEEPYRYFWYRSWRSDEQLQKRTHRHSEEIERCFDVIFS